MAVHTLGLLGGPTKKWQESKIAAISQSLADKLMILALTELDARGGAAIPISEIQAVFRYEFAFQLDQPPPFFLIFLFKAGARTCLQQAKAKAQLQTTKEASHPSRPPAAAYHLSLHTANARGPPFKCSCKRAGAMIRIGGSAAAALAQRSSEYPRPSVPLKHLLSYAQ